MCKLMLILHAVLGFDTTSSLNGIGKGSILKKFKEKVEVRVSFLTSIVHIDLHIIWRRHLLII